MPEGSVQFVVQHLGASLQQKVRPALTPRHLLFGLGIPYWLHFVEKESGTLFHVLWPLCRGHYEGINHEGLMGWRFEDMRQLGDVMETLFGYMNLLYQRLELDEEMNRRISEEVGQLLEGGMGYAG